MADNIRAQVIELEVTETARKLIYSTFGACRYAYNWVVRNMEAEYIAHQEDPTNPDKPLPKTYFQYWTTRWTKERPAWTRGYYRYAQDRAIRNACEAFNNLLNKHAKHPKTHEKGDQETFYIPGMNVHMNNNIFILPVIGGVKMKEPLKLVGQIQSVTIRHKWGKFFAAIKVVCENDPKPICTNPDSIVAMDVGFTHLAYAVDDKGNEFILDTPQYIKDTEDKILREMRVLATKQVGSHNYYKQRTKVQKLYEHMANQRADLLHKFMTDLAQTHGTLITEDPNIAGMVKSANKSLRKCFNVSCMGELIRQGYKFIKHEQANRFFPSTQICSTCGSRQGMTLHDRTYVCQECGTIIDRDKNAALNLLFAGSGRPGVLVDASLKDKGCHLES